MDILRIGIIAYVNVISMDASSISLVMTQPWLLLEQTTMKGCILYWSRHSENNFMCLMMFPFKLLPLVHHFCLACQIFFMYLVLFRVYLQQMSLFSISSSFLLHWVALRISIWNYMLHWLIFYSSFEQFYSLSFSLTCELFYNREFMIYSKVHLIGYGAQMNQE